MFDRLSTPRPASSSSSLFVMLCRPVQGDLYGRANLGYETSEAMQRMIRLVQGLRHCLRYEAGHERGSRTDRSLKDKIENNRALPQRTSSMCAEFPLGGKAGRRHPCDRGCRLGWRPKDKVLHVRRSVGNRSVLHCSTLVCDTGNSIVILSRVRGQDDCERWH